MKRKNPTKLMRIALLLFCSLLPLISIGQKQKQLSIAETQELYNLIKQTKEYKLLRAKADSFNHAQPAENQQDVDTKIRKQDSNAPDDHIFRAVFARSVVSVPLEGYDVIYDRKKRQILSVKKQRQQFTIDP